MNTRMNTRMSTRKAILAIGLGAALSAAPALAVESLTGNWEGSLKCQTLDSGTTTKPKFDQTVVISDGGVDGIRVHLVSTKGIFEGFVVADGKKPANGQISVVSCDFSGTNLVGGVLQADVKTKAGDVKASLKGDLLLMDETNGIIESCSLSVKRVSLKGAAIPTCPGDN
jgi:hypothetical protein